MTLALLGLIHVEPGRRCPWPKPPRRPKAARPVAPATRSRGGLPVTVRRCGVTIARIAVRRLHRHLSKPPRSALVAFEVVREDTRWPVGWALVGRPTSRVLQARGYVEVTRCATDGTPNACSALYGAASRWARETDRPAIVTYTLASESGVSLRAAGWVECGATKGGQFDRPSRRRAKRTGEVALPKRRWCPPWCLDEVLGSKREAA